MFHISAAFCAGVRSSSGDGPIVVQSMPGT
jgi:hypothetical protein